MRRALLRGLLALPLLHCGTGRHAAEPPKVEQVDADAQALLRIAEADPVHAETMRGAPTAFSHQPLGFYARFRLLTADVNLPQRPLRFRYADDGTRVIPLTGAPEDIYKVNGAESLSLEAAELPAYVRFFVENTGGTGRRVVEKAPDIPWLRTADSEPTKAAKKAEAVALLQPMRVTPADPGFRVVVDVLEEGTLSETTLLVHRNGRVDTEQSRELASGLPVPYTL